MTSQALSTTSLPPPVEKARQILSSSTSPHAAIDAARRLIGQWPNAKPHDPETYAASIAAVLSQYPLGLVTECCDPRTGLVRIPRDYPPNAGHVAAWCDERLAHYRTLAAWKPRALPVPELPDDPVMAERLATMLTELAATLRAKGPSPLDVMIEERAAARRLRIEEVMRRAEEPPAAAGAAQ